MGYSITHFSQKAILLFYFCNKYVIITISLQQKPTKKAAALQIFHVKQQLFIYLILCSLNSQVVSYADLSPLSLPYTLWLYLLCSLHKNLIFSFLSHYFLILVQDNGLNPLSCCGVNGMCDIAIFSVTCLAARHCDKQTLSLIHI